MNADLSAFLERFRPDGYTTFVGIVPDGSTVAATFNGADPSKAANWIESQNRARGVYFTANPTPADLRQKPTKSDIVAIASLWGDVDPLDSRRQVRGEVDPASAVLALDPISRLARVGAVEGRGDGRTVGHDADERRVPVWPEPLEEAAKVEHLRLALHREPLGSAPR